MTARIRFRADFTIVGGSGQILVITIHNREAVGWGGRTGYQPEPP